MKPELCQTRVSGNRIESHKTLEESHITLIESHKTLWESHKTLIESHKTLEESQKTFIESHKILAESRKTLIESHKSHKTCVLPILIWNYLIYTKH